MEVLVVIPARGGSKGILKKNLQLINGKSLVERAVYCAKNAKLVSRIVVSTDDEGIGIAAGKAGAEVIKRPGNISGDSAKSETAVLHVLNDLNKEEDYNPEITLLIQCTSPFMIPEDIDGVINKLINEKADSSFAASSFHRYVWAEKGSKGVMGLNHDKNIRKPRQSVMKQYIESGSVYAMKTDSFLETKHRFFGKTVIYEIPAERGLEIDEEIDLHMAKTLSKIIDG